MEEKAVVYRITHKCNVTQENKIILTMDKVKAMESIIYGDIVEASTVEFKKCKFELTYE